MEHIKNTIERIFSNAGIDKKVKQFSIASNWKELVGDDIYYVTHIVNISKGRIFIKVKNDSWRNELVFYKKEIIDKINRRLGEEQITDIVLL